MALSRAATGRIYSKSVLQSLRTSNTVFDNVGLDSSRRHLADYGSIAYVFKLTPRFREMPPTGHYLATVLFGLESAEPIKCNTMTRG